MYLCLGASSVLAMMVGIRRHRQPGGDRTSLIGDPDVHGIVVARHGNGRDVIGQAPVPVERRAAPDPARAAP